MHEEHTHWPFSVKRGLAEEVTGTMFCVAIHQPSAMLYARLWKHYSQDLVLSSSIDCRGSGHCSIYARSQTMVLRYNTLIL